MIRFLYFLVLFFISITWLQAAPPVDLNDEDFRPVPWFTSQQLNSPFPVDTNYVDTLLAGFHRYDPYFRNNLFMAEKGNIGHAAVSMLFQPDLRSNFSLFPASLYPGHLFTPDGIHYYRPRYVYTNLYYMNGDSREQLFVANHNQKLHETLHVGAVYQVVNSPGFYDRLAARNSNIQVHFDFRESTGKYEARGSAIFNRINNQESGGILDYRAFEQNSNLEQVVLSQAVSRHKENIFNLEHFYNLGFYLDDPEPDDSLSQRPYTNLGRLGHQFTYRRLALVFDEGTTPYREYYGTPPIFNGSTYDSTVVSTVENRLSWSNYPVNSENKPFPVHFKVYALHQIVRVRQPGVRRMYNRSRLFEIKRPVFLTSASQSYLFEEDQFNQLITGVQAESNPNRFLSARVVGDYTAGGYNDGDVFFGGSVDLNAARQHSVSFDINYAEKESPYFLSSFRGNYVSWNNDLKKNLWLKAGAKYINPWLSLEARYYRVKNFSFMGAEALPVQNADAVNVFSAHLHSRFGLGIFRTSNDLILQTVDDDFFVHFPEFAGRHAAYFDFFMFKRALAVQAGFDLYYNLAYAPMGYMPVVRQFYAQDQFSGRDNLMVDVFANFRVSRTRIFVKYENIQGLVLDSPPVYLIPFYPIPRTALKFGLSWMFFD